MWKLCCVVVVLWGGCAVWRLYCGEAELCGGCGVRWLCCAVAVNPLSIPLPVLFFEVLPILPAAPLAWRCPRRQDLLLLPRDV